MEYEKAEQNRRETVDKLDDLAVDMGDKAIEAILSDDVFKQIPILKNALAVAKIVSSIRDSILLKNWIGFYEHWRAYLSMNVRR